MARKSHRSRRARINAARSKKPSPMGLEAMVEKAKLCLATVGVELEQWSAPTWRVSESVFKLTGRHVATASMSFLGEDIPPGAVGQQWEEAAKAIFVLRQHQNSRAITSHRTFMSAVRFVARCANGRALSAVTPEVLDAACELIKESTDSEAQQYKLCCMVAEFARQWCARYGLCHVDLSGYRFCNVERPDNYGGPSNFRLDSLAALETESSRVLSERSLALLGELYQKLPKDHVYRIYILLLIVLFCVGRRFSEVAYLPRRCIVRRADGNYLRYIQTKDAGVHESRDFLLVPIPSLTCKLLRDIIAEIKWSSRSKYAVAKEMLKRHGPDLRFLEGVAATKPLLQKDLLRIGLPGQCLSSTGWFAKNDRIKLCASKRGGRPHNYVLKQDVVEYCQRHYHSWLLAPLFVVDGRGYGLTDLLFLRQYGVSSGFYAHWIVQPISHSMLTTTLRYLDEITTEFCSSCFDQDFTSHDFRHTLNDALDRGGLSDLMQTEYFGRKYAADTKVYQHSSPQYRALQLRKKIKLGEVGGAIPDRAMNLPVDKREIYLNSEVRAVHDLGLGICLHVWSHGPCPRHLECASGCGKFSWLRGLEGESQAEQVAEAKRQICSNLLVLCNAFDDLAGKVGGVEPWVSHLFIKIKNLKQLLRETDKREENFDQYGIYWESIMPGAHTLDRAKIDKAYQYYLANHERYLSLVEVDHG